MKPISIIAMLIMMGLTTWTSCDRNIWEQRCTDREYTIERLEEKLEIARNAQTVPRWVAMEFSMVAPVLVEVNGDSVMILDRKSYDRFSSMLISGCDTGTTWNTIYQNYTSWERSDDHHVMEEY